MRADASILGTLATHFLILSLLAIGGANTVIPEMHRQAVEVAGWMTDRQFADLFAIAQVAPGPNIIIVTLVGFHVAGIAGGLVATVAMCIPSCLFAYAAGLTWRRYQDARWRVIIQSGMVPISVGLVAATALILARAADNTIAAVLITIATAGVTYFTRAHPLWVFALAAALGYAGLV